MLRLITLSAITELLYLLMAVASRTPVSDSAGADWYQARHFEETPEFLALWIGLFAVYVIAVRAVGSSTSRGVLVAVLLTGTLFRATLVSEAQFRDINHRFFLYGETPFSAALAMGSELLPDDLDKTISGLSPGANKTPGRAAIATLADLGSLLIVPGLLRAAGLPAGLTILHAWNPLVVKEIAGSGHLDSFAVFFLLLAIRVFQSSSRWLASCAYGFSLTTSPLVAATLPVLSARLRAAALLALTFAATAWALYQPGSPWAEKLGWPPSDFMGGSLFPSMWTVARVVVTRNPVAPVMAAALAWILMALLQLVRAEKDPWGLPRDSLLAVAALVLLAPQAPPWAFVPFASLAAFTSNRSIVGFTATAPLTYLALGGGSWNFWLGFLQYFLPFVALIYAWLGSSARERRRDKPREARP